MESYEWGKKCKLILLEEHLKINKTQSKKHGFTNIHLKLVLVDWLDQSLCEIR